MRENSGLRTAGEFTDLLTFLSLAKPGPARAK
jgi:hypothetical protein